MAEADGSEDEIFLSTPSSQRATRDAGEPRDLLHHFYPRPLRRGRPGAGQLAECHDQFLSTPSSQRATRSRWTSCSTMRDFYPRPLRRGRLCDGGLRSWHRQISIHALFAEGDRLPADPAGGV